MPTVTWPGNTEKNQSLKIFPVQEEHVINKKVVDTEEVGVSRRWGVHFVMDLEGLGKYLDELGTDETNLEER